MPSSPGKPGGSTLAQQRGSGVNDHKAFGECSQPGFSRGHWDLGGGEDSALQEGWRAGVFSGTERGWVVQG